MNDVEVPTGSACRGLGHGILTSTVRLYRLDGCEFHLVNIMVHYFFRMLFYAWLGDASHLPITKKLSWHTSTIHSFKAVGCIL